MSVTIKEPWATTLFFFIHSDSDCLLKDVVTWKKTSEVTRLRDEGLTSILNNITITTINIFSSNS